MTAHTSHQSEIDQLRSEVVESRSKVAEIDKELDETRRKQAEVAEHSRTRQAQKALLTADLDGISERLAKLEAEQQLNADKKKFKQLAKDLNSKSVECKEILDQLYTLMNSFSHQDVNSIVHIAELKRLLPIIIMQTGSSRITTGTAQYLPYGSDLSQIEDPNVRELLKK